MQSIAFLPIDILDDGMVNAIIYRNSRSINYGKALIFVTTLPKVIIQAS